MTSKRNVVAIFVLGFLLKIVNCEEIINQENLSVSSTNYSIVETTESTAKEPLHNVLNLDAPTNETIDTKIDIGNPISSEQHKIHDDKVSESTISTNTIKSIDTDKVSVSTISTNAIKSTHDDKVSVSTILTNAIKSTHDDKVSDSTISTNAIKSTHNDKVSVSTTSSNTIKSTLLPIARKVEEFTPYPFRRPEVPGDHSWGGVKPANNSNIRYPMKSVTTQTVMTIKSIDSENATVPTLKDVNKRRRKNHRRHRHHHRNANVKSKPKPKITEATTGRHRPIKQHSDNKHAKSHLRKSARRHHNSQSRTNNMKNDGEHHRKISNFSHHNQTENTKEERPHKPLYREKFSRSKRSVKHSLKEPTTSKAKYIPYELNNSNKSVNHLKKGAVSPLNDKVNDLVGEKKLQKTSVFASHLKDMIARLRKTFDSSDSNRSNTESFEKYNHSMHELIQTTQKSHKSHNIEKEVIKQFLLGRIITSLSAELSTMNHSDAEFNLESTLEEKEVDGTTNLLIDATSDNVVKHISYANPLQLPVAESHLKQRNSINDTLRQSKTWLDGPFYRALFSDNRKKRDLHIIEAVNGTWSTTSTTEKKFISLNGEEEGFFPLDLDTSYPNEDIRKVVCPHSVFVMNLEHNLKKSNTANDNTDDLINEIVPILLDEVKSFRNDQTISTKYQIKETGDIIKQKSQIFSNDVPAPEKLIYVEKMNNLENNVVKHLAGFFPKMYRMSKSSRNTVIRENNSGDDIKRTDEFRRPVYMTLSILLDVLAVFTLFVILYFYLRSNGYCYRVVMIDRRIPKIKINFDRVDQKDADHQSGMNVNLINTP